LAVGSPGKLAFLDPPNSRRSPEQAYLATMNGMRYLVRKKLVRKLIAYIPALLESRLSLLRQGDRLGA